MPLSSIVRLPMRHRVRSPLAKIGIRFGIAVGIVLVNWLMVALERGGYRDSADGNVSVLDALYYTTVTLSTTGYGDITPVTTTARLINALVVTPLRLVFVVLLVGTTINALTSQSRREISQARWRKRVEQFGNTIVVLGYGTKGRSAVKALVLKGCDPHRIVVVDARSAAVTAATAGGYVAVQGNATDEIVLEQAMVGRAQAVIVAVDRDDTAILATLTVRRLNPDASITASARESQHADLLRQSGATSVIVSSETTGRLLGLAPTSPESVAVVEDLLAFGVGLDIAERPVTAAEVGRSPRELDVPVLAVVRDGRTLHYDDPAATPLRAGDRIVHAVTVSGS